MEIITYFGRHRKSLFVLLAASVFILINCTSPQRVIGQTIPAAEVQIKTALLAAPQSLREGATVLGYNPNGELVEIKKGSNDLICLADDPKIAGLSVAAYHRELEPFMTRGRQLRALGNNPSAVTELRDTEARDGKFKMPAQPTTLYVFTAKADDYDALTGVVKAGNLRYVVYVPFATGESTGLPVKPEAPGMPWLMDAGTYRAHIMITPAAR